MSELKLLSPAVRSENLSRFCALGIMTKAPEPGKVKTRLTPPLTATEAAELNICFLRDLSCSIDAVSKQTAARGVAIYTPVGKESAYRDILPSGFPLIPQREGNFGNRLQYAVSDLLAAGFASACLINSDSPTVPEQNFAEAANELAKPGDRIVLGPSDDGGYYLIGLKKIHRRVFENIEWSTERVLEQTLQRAEEIGVPVYQLPPGYDVDDGATLRRLCDELLEGGSNLNVAPSTRQFLTRIIQGEGRDRIWPQM